MSTGRTVHLVRPPADDSPGILAISAKEKPTYYAFREIACAIGGRGFVLHRLGLGALYHVRVGRPVECSCECMGFLAHGHCKHVQALRALLRHGFI